MIKRGHSIYVGKKKKDIMLIVYYKWSEEVYLLLDQEDHQRVLCSI